MSVTAIFTRLPVIAATILLTLSSGFVAAQSEPASNQSPAVSDRPRIGLALGGGGAKGAAHVGVLQVLDELRIPIDCVAGTSMGALGHLRDRKNGRRY